MTKRFNILYPIAAALLVMSYVVTMVFPSFLTNFDFILIVYFVMYERLDDDNYIWLSLIFGVFADFSRGGFFGPAAMIFLLFSYVRFKADLVVDMSKFNSKVMLFALMSFIYCSFNLFVSGYDENSILVLSFFRTILNVGGAVVVIKIAGYVSVIKNS